MKSKIAFVIGLAIGYVFGTRAGRQRYEQIKSGAIALWNSSLVRKGRDQVNDYASDLRGTMQDSVLESGRAFINALIDRQKSQTKAEPGKPAKKSATPAKKPTQAKTASTAHKPKSQAASKPRTAEEPA